MIFSSFSIEIWLKLREQSKKEVENSLNLKEQFLNFLETLIWSSTLKRFIEFKNLIYSHRNFASKSFESTDCVWYTLRVMSLRVEQSVNTTILYLKRFTSLKSDYSLEYLPYLRSQVRLILYGEESVRESTSVQSCSDKENWPFDKLQFLTSVSQSLLPRPVCTNLWLELPS